MHLYLDYQDGQWPEVHTVLFSPGAHDWEEEDHPRGAYPPGEERPWCCWSSTSPRAPRGSTTCVSTGNGTEHNLLAAPGFEEEDPAAVQAQAMGAEYEKQVQTLLESVQAAAQSPDPAETLRALGNQVDRLAASVADKGLAAYFPRELRDLDDARDKRGSARGCWLRGSETATAAARRSTCGRTAKANERSCL